MFIWFVFIMGYCFCGAITGGIVAYHNRLSDDDANPLIVLAAVFWPFAIIGAIVVGIAVGTHKSLVMLGRSMGTRKHRSNILRQTVQMMEQDQQRLGSTELAVQWDYKPCPRCYGSGCKKCGDGVVRVKNRTVVDSHGHTVY